ncbi:hypothetical protein [Paenibacillus sp. Soil724D2]|nr:hypothetical protein [Paenibacillus sp. Soil724D2]
MFDWLVEIEKPNTIEDSMDGALEIKRTRSQSDTHDMSDVVSCLPHIL